LRSSPRWLATTLVNSPSHSMSLPLISWDVSSQCSNNHIASPSSTVVPVSVPPTLLVSFPSSKEEKLSGVLRGGSGVRMCWEKRDGYHFASIGIHQTCMSSAGQLFASQYKDLVAMKHERNKDQRDRQAHDDEVHPSVLLRRRRKTFLFLSLRIS
jgi:hypothetical protein